MLRNWTSKFWDARKENSKDFQPIRSHMGSQNKWFKRIEDIIENEKFYSRSVKTKKTYLNRACILETAWNLIRGVQIEILKSGSNIVTVRIQALPFF